MRRITVILMLLALATGGRARAEEGSATFYIKLIRGTDTDQAPVPGAKAVGPKLAGTFRPVFKCKGFWEINRQEVVVLPGKVKRVQLGNGREAEIDLSAAKERKVAAFQDGKLVDRTSVPQGEGMTIIGGSREDKSVWFIVVRRDKPQD
jgi:hypothetical protein